MGKILGIVCLVVIILLFLLIIHLYKRVRSRKAKSLLDPNILKDKGVNYLIWVVQSLIAIVIIVLFFLMVMFFNM